MLKAGFISLGCPKNLVDTEIMLGIIQDNQIEVTNNPSEADLLFVNTCGFIESAKEESISTILQLSQYKLDGKCKGLIVTGCLGQRYAHQLINEIPEIDAIVGTGAIHRILEAINCVLSGQKTVIIDKLDSCYPEQQSRLITTPLYSAYVKIAEGCNNRCSYCIIPTIRGPYRSRSIESITAEVQSLTDNGVKEVILIAQDTTNYGRDLYDSPKLLQLLQELVKNEQLTWIRLLYCYPANLSTELLSFIASQPQICNYIDLPLQHADNAILQKMCRRDTKKEVEKLLDNIRQQIPNVAVRTSFIVGFPGETDEHFQTLKKFILAQRFDRVGIFPYSQEEGTAAAELDDQIPETVKQERYHELMSLQSKISEEINITLEGKIIDVLIEGFLPDQPNIAFGRSYREAPNIDGTIYVENVKAAIGTFVKAKVLQGFTYDLLTEQIED